MGYVSYIPGEGASIGASLANIGSGLAHAINPNMDLQTHMQAAMALHPELGQALSDRAYNSDDPKFLQKMGLGGKVESMIRSIPPSPAAVTLGKARHQAGDDMDSLAKWAQTNLPEGSPERQTFMKMVSGTTEEEAAENATKASTMRAQSQGLIAGAQLSTQNTQEDLARNTRLAPILNNPSAIIPAVKGVADYIRTGDPASLNGMDKGVAADLMMHKTTGPMVNAFIGAGEKGDVNDTRVRVAELRKEGEEARKTSTSASLDSIAAKDIEAGMPASVPTLKDYYSNPATQQRASALYAGTIKPENDNDQELMRIAKFKAENSKAGIQGAKGDQAASTQGAKDMDAIGKEISSPKFDSNDADNSAVRFNEAAQRAGSDLRATVNHPKFLGHSTVVIKDAKGNEVTPGNVGSHLSLDTGAIVKEYNGLKTDSAKAAWMGKLAKKDPATRALVMSAIQQASSANDTTNNPRPVITP